MKIMIRLSRENKARLLALAEARGEHHDWTLRALLDEAARQDALGRILGSQPDVYPPGYLDDLRREWPD